MNSKLKTKILVCPLRIEQSLPREKYALKEGTIKLFISTILKEVLYKCVFMEQIIAFNKKIESLIDGGNNTAFSMIKQLKDEFSNYPDYYSMLDSLSYRLGFGLIAQEYADAKTGKTLGYIPLLKYYPDNKFGEVPGLENLGAEEPLKLKDCYGVLAKACLYKMTQLTNIVEKTKE